MASVPPPSSRPPPSESSRPSGSGAAKPAKGARPRYLLVALIGAMIFGAGCWTEGCGRLTFYRGGEQEMRETLNASIKSDVDRAHAEALYKRFTDVSDEQRNRAIPMAAAIFVLGAALLAFAARGLAGKTSSRNVLVQVVSAQAVAMVVSFYATRDIRNAELDWEFEMQRIHQQDRLPPDQYEQVVPMLKSMRLVLPPGWLLIRTLASGLIVFALTRPRSREFFEAAKGTVSER